MTILEKANDAMLQAVTGLSVSLGDILGSAFLRLVGFFLDLLLGL